MAESRASALLSDRAPIGHLLRKADPGKPCVGKHPFDLLPRESLLEPGAEPVIGIGAHDVEFPFPIGLERNGGRRKPGALDQRRKTRKRPIDDNRDDLADDEAQPWRQRRNDQAENITETPDRAVPPWTVVQRIIE